jgi:hypothetical protein
MEHSDEKLLRTDFEFADFTAPDAGGEGRRHALGISRLSYEERLGIFRLARN